MGFLWGQFLKVPPHLANFQGRRSQRGTHALILGISSYLPVAKQEYGFNDLDCAALSALRMAKWLVGDYQSASGAPLASLRLLLSPSALERSLIDDADLDDVAACTGENVGKALDEWVDDLASPDGNVGVLYGAGHGMRYQGDGPLLLLEDFWSSRSFANALDFPTSNLCLNGLPLNASFLFADCCQQINEVVEANRVQSARFAPVDGRLPQRRQGWGLYRAAAGGDYAYGVRGSTTFFVEALIDGLNGRSATHGDSNQWEVTTDSLKAILPGLVNERYEAQHVRGQSEGAQAAFHRLGKAPEANLSISVNPEKYALTASGSIDSEGTIMDRFDFANHPYTKPLPSGFYRVAVEARPPVHFLKPTQDVTVKPFNGGNVEFKVRL